MYSGVTATLARAVNDSMAEQQRANPDRIRWFASLPWLYATDARTELERCVEKGAVGVMVLGSIDGKDLVDPQFGPIWSEIDRLALPVLVHPTAPQGVRDMHMQTFNLIPPVGFMFDTTLAFAHIIFS
jgi:aminocarboxymuconate-semialdehyde decarboxylase